MPSETGARAHTTIAVCALAGAVCFLSAALFLLIDAVFGHGGQAGNILRIGLGLVSSFIGLFLLAFGITWHKANSEQLNDAAAR